MKGKMRGHPVRVIDRDLLLALNTLKDLGDIKVAIVVIDNTIGWQRDTAEISLSTFCHDTGMSNLGVRRAIKRLVKQSVIRIMSKGNSYRHPTSYMLNRHSNWVTELHSTVQESNTVNGEKQDAKLHSDTSHSYTVDDAKLHSTVLLTTPAAPPIKKEKNSLRNSLKKGSEGGTGETDISLKEKNEELKSCEGDTPSHNPEETFSLNEENGENESNVPATEDRAKTWDYILDNAPEDTRKTPAFAILKHGCSLESLDDHRIRIRVANLVHVEMLDRPEFKSTVLKIVQNATPATEVKYVCSSKVPASAQSTGQRRLPDRHSYTKPEDLHRGKYADNGPF